VSFTETHELNMTKSIYSGARQLVSPHVQEIRAYERLYPKSPVPSQRRTPTALELWRHFIKSMITSQQLINADLWNRLENDPRWRTLRAGGPGACPSERAIATLFKEQRIRFPKQKAHRIRLARSRDFAGIALLSRSVLREAHDRRSRPEKLRAAEVNLAVALQEELAGCGVAPKIARLLMRFTGEFEHVIPVDSRWKNALDAVGVTVEQADFARENTYVIIENELARAAYDLGVSPVHADGAVFGWVQASIAEVAP